MVFEDANRNLGGLVAGQVIAINVAGIFEDNGLVSQRRILDVKILELGVLLELSGGEVFGIEVEALVVVAVGEEIDRVAGPHGEDIAGGVIGDVFGFLGLEIMDPDIVGHAAAVAFPGAELAEDAVVSELAAVRREGAETAARQGNLLVQPPLGRHQEKLADEIVWLDHARAENDVVVVLPAHDDIVGPHAIGDVVAFQGGGEGEALGDSPVRGHDVDLGVAVVLPGKGELLAVGGEVREHLVAFMAGEPACHASAGRHRVQVAGIAEHHLVAMNGGKAEQTRLILVLGKSRRRHQEKQSQGQRFSHEKPPKTGVRGYETGISI